jgi:ATP-dependent 26S proteasome regulatory subunit
VPLSLLSLLLLFQQLTARQTSESEEGKYVITLRQYAKFVVGLGKKVAPTDIEEGMRVGVDRTKWVPGAGPL